MINPVNQLNVYLVNPPAPGNNQKIVREGRCMQRQGAWTAVWPPLSLALSAAVAESAGADKVKLSDCIVEEISLPVFRKNIAEFKPHIVVINTATPSISEDLSTARTVKELFPYCFTIAFGIHVSALPEESLQSEPALDAVIIGEPEFVLRDIITKMTEDPVAPIERWNNFKSWLYKIPGLAIQPRLLTPTELPAKSSIYRTSVRNSNDDLNTLPFPAWQHINFKYYQMPFAGEPFLLVPTARGCPGRCTFCAAKSYYGSKLRFRSPERVVDEIEFNLKTHGIRQFLFWSESFTINNQYAGAVCDEIINRQLAVKWVANSRVDDINPWLLAKMKLAGCFMIGYGIESGNQKSLDNVKKDIQLSDIRQAVELTQNFNIEVTGHVILGLPGESEKDVWRTIKFVSALNLDFAQFYCLVPFPGSTIFREYKKLGYINSSDWSNFEQNISVIDTPELSAATLIKLRRSAFLYFYLRPRAVIKIISRLDSRRKWLEFLSMVRDFMKWI